jgi:hypothetical protein
MNKFDKALHDLICSSLRGCHIRDLNSIQLQKYCYNLGVALHNIPNELTTTGKVPPETYRSINELDPSGSKSNWGDWSIQFSHAIGQELPEVA